jgi:hypothetical protein
MFPKLFKIINTDCKFFHGQIIWGKDRQNPAIILSPAYGGTLNNKAVAISHGGCF